MTGLWERFQRFYREEVWSREPLHPAPLAWLRSLAQLVIVIVEGFWRDQLLMRAHSLTYLTVLSIVPLMALAVSFAGLIGVRDRVLELLVTQLTATVPQAAEYLARWTRKLDFGALGPVMGGILIATTVLAIGGIERALNAIWGVQKQRPWVRRVPDYLAVLVIAPLLLGIAIPLRASLESQWLVQRLLSLPVFAQLYDLGLAQAPLLLVIAAFSFLYWFLPNTEVHGRSALLGGLVGGVLFAVVQKLYILLNVGAARYNAIFGTFAAVPLFMVWVYMSWSIILLGAEVAYAHQTLGRYRREVRGAPAGPATREAIGLAIALACGRAFDEGRPPWTVEQLSEALDVPMRTVRDVTERLADAGILSLYGGPSPDAFQLGRPAERIRVGDVLRALRGERTLHLSAPGIQAEVVAVLGEVDAAAGKVSEERTLRHLLDEMVPAPRRDAAGADVEPRAASS